MKLSITHHWANKTNEAPKRVNQKTGELSNLYAHAAFENVDWTTEQIAKHIRAGRAICPAELVNGWRSGENFLSAQLVGLDFDASPGIDALVADDFLKGYAFLVYPTPSHTDDKPRHRALFALDAPITDAKRYACLMRRLVAKYAAYGVDAGCIDPVRKWNGSDVKGGAANKDKVLPLAVLEALPKTEDELRAEQPREPRTVYKPSNDAQTRRVEGYSRATVEGIVNDALANNVDGMRHNAFISAAFKLVSIAKGDGWLGIDAEQEARLLGKDLNREADEIEDAIRGAYRKADPRDLELSEDTPPVAQDAHQQAEAPSSVGTPTPTQNGVKTPVNGNHAIVWKSTADSMQAYRQRQKHAPEKLGKRPPIIFPFKVLHQFHGLFHVIKPGFLMAVVGGSGTTKTGFMETVTGKWMEQYPLDVIWWGVEMNWEVSADRAVQRMGGTTVTENWLHELALSEEFNGVPFADRHGVRLHPSQLRRNEEFAGDMEYGWKGQLHQIEAPIKSIEILLEASADKASDLRKEGRNPYVVVWDYIQLLEMQGGGDAATKMARLTTTMKHHAVKHDYFGMMVSQITKNASANAKKLKEVIDIEAAQNFRGDETNAALTLTPVYNEDTGEITKQGIMNIAKNSFGRPGKVRVWIDPARYTWLDEIADEDVFSDRMYAEARESMVSLNGNGRKDHDD